jgi:Kef-type K+ transport system membrane component KefB
MHDADVVAHVVHTLVLEIGITVLVGSILSYLFNLARLPLILAFLTTGVVIGANVGFGFVQSEVGLANVSEIGLILLLFMIGLEIDINKLRSAGPSLVVTGVLQFAISASLGLGFFLMLGFVMGGGSFDLFYLAVGAAISSTAVVVKLLYAKSELDTLSGRLTVGVLVFQDIWAIVILGLLPSLSDPEILQILLSFGKMGLMVAIAIGVSKYLLPSIFKRIAKSPELIILSSLGWCIAICGIAMAFGLSIEMGALIAGVGMSTFPYTLDVEAKLSNLRDVLIMLFFVSLGMMIPNPMTNPSLLLVAVAGSVFVILARILSVFPFLKALRNGNRVGLLTSLNLSNVSEFSLVIAAIGIREGHIESDVLTILIFMFVFSAIGASFIIKNSNRIQHVITTMVLDRLGLRDRKEHPEDAPFKLDKDIAFLGFFRVASSMVEEFRTHQVGDGEKTLLDRSVVIDFNEANHDKLRAMGVTTIYGDIANMDTLHHVGIEDVKLAISTIPDSLLVGTSNAKMVEEIRTICPHAKVIATAESPRAALLIYDAGADYVIIARSIVADHLVPITTDFLAAADGSDRANHAIDAMRQSHMQELKTRLEVVE